MAKKKSTMKAGANGLIHKHRAVDIEPESGAVDVDLHPRFSAPAPRSAYFGSTYVACRWRSWYRPTGWVGG